MELEKIWKTYNISFILILPLFKNIIQHIKTKNNYNVSIHSLFCEYGLINCYLLNSKSEYDGYLKLVFSKNKVLTNDLLDKIDKPVASLLDLLISSKYFYTLKELENYVIIYLKIDNHWEKDITHIMNSEYSKVSKEYKEFITYKGSYVMSDDDIINYLYLKNIPAKIIIKHESLHDIIKKVFKVDKSFQLEEVFIGFSKEKESLILNKKQWFLI